MNASIKAYRSNVHIQHAPGLDLFRHGKGGEVSNSHDDIPKFLEKVTLEGFRKEIRNYVFGGVVSHFDPTLFDLVCDIEVFNVEVARSLA